MKAKTLWLARDKFGYAIFRRKPKFEKNFLGYRWEERGWDNATSFCTKTFVSVAPSLRLKLNYCVQIKLTNLKNGIKLEKVGRPFKG